MAAHGTGMENGIKAMAVIPRHPIFVSLKEATTAVVPSVSECKFVNLIHALLQSCRFERTARQKMPTCGRRSGRNRLRLLGVPSIPGLGKGYDGVEVPNLAGKLGWVALGDFFVQQLHWVLPRCRLCQQSDSQRRHPTFINSVDKTLGLSGLFIELTTLSL